MTGPANSWRDRIKVHPAAELFPMMSEDELVVLGNDIAENGLQQAIVFWTPGRLGRRPKEVYLLDGQNRLAAIELAFATDARRCAEVIDNALYIGNDGARLLHGDDDPWAFVASANAHRRHLTLEQKKALVEKLLLASPSRSNNATAGIAKVSDKTVGAVRREMEGRSEFPNVSTRTDTAGRQQPATKPARPPKVSKLDQIRALRERHVAPPISKAGVAFHAERAEPPAVRDLDELKSVLAMLRGDPGRIANLSMERRVKLAGVCLAFLNLTLDDLRAAEGAA
jgi:hypothetical protein